MADEEETQVEETEEDAQPDEGSHDEEGSGEERETMDSDAVNKKMEEVEENPPDKLEDWPDGAAKYRTIGGGDASESWEEGPTAKLGPSDVRYFEDGSVTVRGEEVDNPEDFKGDPIPGGPTDPDAPDDPSGIEDEDKDEGGSGSEEAEGSDATDGGDESRDSQKPDEDEKDE